MTQLIVRSLVRLEGVDRIESTLVDQLYCADRNYLLVELRRVTFGDVLRAHYLCPACQRDVQRIESLQSLDVRRLGDSERLEPGRDRVGRRLRGPEGRRASRGRRVACRAAPTKRSSRRTPSAT